MRKTLYSIIIGGRNISTFLNPILQQITVTDGTDNEADSASIILDDTDGKTFLANARDPVQIYLGSIVDGGLRQVFDGFVDEPRSKGNRGAGRTISIECASVDLEGKAKEPVEKHWENKDVKTIVTDAMNMAGIPTQVSAEFSSTIREYEMMDGEDPLSFVSRLAREVGATFKPMGSRAVFVSRNSGMSAGGILMPSFSVVEGDNLIDWDLSPIIPRAKFAKFTKRWHDFDKNKIMEESADAEGKANLLHNSPKATKGLAKETSSGEKAEAERKGGEGTIVALGSSIPQANGMCNLSGARQGIDGTYLMKTVTHSASRGNGYTVSLDVGLPSGGAGVDSR